jgi:hypothetical protein
MFYAPKERHAPWGAGGRFFESDDRRGSKSIRSDGQSRHVTLLQFEHWKTKTSLSRSQLAARALKKSGILQASSCGGGKAGICADAFI